jgi:primosomal protein N' (replication factor Y)
VPEIALTAQVVEIFVGRFSDQVAVLHSRLSDGERHDEWRRIQLGDARIVVGARSAIFAPVKNVGLIILDEEHESSYKQESHPRYSAREVAARRAGLSGAVLLLGSATPSVETYWQTHNPGPDGKLIQRIEMPERIDRRPLPHVEIIDLRAEFKIRRALFSERLTDAIGNRLKIGQQTILFLNRRGYSQFVLCRDCGWTAKCSNCAVSLTYHSGARCLKCHHCGLICAVPAQCPTCSGSSVRAFGVGTEKVEEEVLRIYPSARVARMDRDTTAKKGDHARILKQFREGEADVLIGTQMVAKGLDFPSVTLVGVISADTSINMPDFRAAERTFQLLTQVAGRAGRGKNPGEVIIQTFSPDNYAVQAAIRHDYVRFYLQEIEYRKELGYPPYSRLVNLVCSHELEADAETQCSEIARALHSVKPKQVELIGPSPAPLARLKGLYRFHVALRCADSSISLADVVRQALANTPSENRRGLTIDMDPQNMA